MTSWKGPGPLVVESFGLPGAGKTSVADRVVGYLIQQGRRVATQKDIGQMVSQLTRAEKVLLAREQIQWADFLGLLSHIAASRPLTREVVKRTLQLPFLETYLNAYIERLRPDILCLDQWTTQAIWSTMVGLRRWAPMTSARLWSRLVARLPRALLFFEIDVEEAARRIEGRSHGASRFDGLTREDVVRRLLVERERMDHLHRVVIRSGMPLLTVDAKAPIHLKTKSIIQFIDQVTSEPLLSWDGFGGRQRFPRVPPAK